MAATGATVSSAVAAAEAAAVAVVAAEAATATGIAGTDTVLLIGPKLRSCLVVSLSPY